jgi:hypothetical protein
MTQYQIKMKTVVVMFLQILNVSAALSTIIFSILAMCTTAFSVTAFRIMIPSVLTPSITTFSILTLRIQKNNIQENDTKHDHHTQYDTQRTQHDT